MTYDAKNVVYKKNIRKNILLTEKSPTRLTPQVLNKAHLHSMLTYYEDADLNSVQEVKLHIKQLLIRGLNKAIVEYKLLLPSNSTKFDEIILLESRYNRFKSAFENGLIDRKALEKEITRIERCFILLLNEAEAADLKLI
jgi:hypothetical protein